MLTIIVNSVGALVSDWIKTTNILAFRYPCDGVLRSRS